MFIQSSKRITLQFRQTDVRSFFFFFLHEKRAIEATADGWNECAPPTTQQQRTTTISVTTDLVFFFFFSLGFLSLSLGLFELTFSYLVGLYQTACFFHPHTHTQKEEKRGTERRETRCLSRIDSRHLPPPRFFFQCVFFFFLVAAFPSFRFFFFPPFTSKIPGYPWGLDQQEKTQSRTTAAVVFHSPISPLFFLWAVLPISSSRPGNAFKFDRIG